MKLQIHHNARKISKYLWLKPHSNHSDDNKSKTSKMTLLENEAIQFSTFFSFIYIYRFLSTRAHKFVSNWKSNFVRTYIIYGI